MDVVLRKVYRPGEFWFVDDDGDPVVDPRTCAIDSAPLFVAVLGYSHDTFVELHRGQTRAAWLDGHRHAFAFVGGVPRIVVPDNPQALVWDHRHDGVLDPSYQEFAAHDHVAVVPARPGRPRDKAQGENHVLLVERWIVAPLCQTRLVGRTMAQTRLCELLQPCQCIFRVPLASVSG